MRAFPDLQIGAITSVGLDWGVWIPLGETILQFEFSADDDGIRLFDASNNNGVTQTKVEALKSGLYIITTKITLSDGKVEPRSTKLRVVKNKSS